MTRARANPNSQRHAFTLIELLVVIGVIAVLAAVVFAGLSGSDRGVALRSAQATMANALNAARTRAVTKGVNVALMVQNDPGNPDRYRRVVAVVETVTGTPVVVSIFELPEHVAVLPSRTRFTADMREPGDWVGGYSGNGLGSTFLGSTISVAIADTATENWEYRDITPNGTVAGAGSIVVGTVRNQPGGTYPIIFVSPEQVRGLTVSSYALARMINDRQGF